MNQGTVADFLELVAESEALQRDLVELAAKHDFEFTTGELTDADLEGIAGGGGSTIIIIDPGLKKPVAGGEPPLHG